MRFPFAYFQLSRRWYKNAIFRKKYIASESKKKFAYAIVGAVGIGAFGSFYFMQESLVKAHFEIPTDITPSKRIQFPSGNESLKLTLYQYQTCPFCCKVRAFLNYQGISYDVVEVNPVMRQQIKFSPWKKVPILIAQDKKGIHQLNDSSMIISSLQSLLLDERQTLDQITVNYPLISYKTDEGKEMSEIVNRYFIMYGDKALDKTYEELESERKWRMWTDNVLVHTLSPNIYRTLPESFEAFKWFSEVGEWTKNFSLWERYLVIYVGATAMYLVGKRLKKRHRLKEDVRESIYDACREWMRNVGQKPFRGGSKPDLSDLAVYGVLSAIEGCETFADIQKKTRIGEWYKRMKYEIESHSNQTSATSTTTKALSYNVA